MRSIRGEFGRAQPRLLNGAQEGPRRPQESDRARTRPRVWKVSNGQPCGPMQGEGEMRRSECCVRTKKAERGNRVHELGQAPRARRSARSPPSRMGGTQGRQARRQFRKDGSKCPSARESRTYQCGGRLDAFYRTRALGKKL